MQRAEVVRRDDRDRRESFGGARPKDPERDFTPVCNEDCVHFEHDEEA
jgi:hypothetical protein